MRTILTALFIIVLIGQVHAEETLTREMQVEIIGDYMRVTGQGGLGRNATTDKTDDGPPLKCGTSAILNFVTHYDKLDPELLKSLGVAEISRPTYLTDSVDSPRGLFRIHYTTSGFDALEGGTPTAVKIADIMDSVYAHIVDTLGYPPPPQDGYEEGGDEKYDIYMLFLGSTYYGQTWTDSLFYPQDQQATSYIEMNARPSSLFGYEQAPLDAIRVTAAHEFFHAVQFGIDWGETEIDDLGGGKILDRRYWMEMSATWMEEEMYDDINDYYSYLPYFYNIPEASLQQFSGGTDLHPYASVVYPIFLSERFGRDIIRDIWLLCGSMGFGPSFLRAADSAILKASNRAEDWTTAFSEFALWNYLTGERSGLTIKNGNDDSPVIGYSEKEAYPAIPFDKLHTHYRYPDSVVSNENILESPRVNGSYYFSLNELASAKIAFDTTYWVCDTVAGDEFPNCTDSFQVKDTLNYMPWYYSFTVNVDSLFSIYLALGNPYAPPLPAPWGVNIVYQFEEEPDSLVVDRFFPFRPAGYEPYKIALLDHTLYRSIAFILTPATTNRAFYENPAYRIMWVGYDIGESSVVDSLVNRPAAVLDLYPNPMVAAEMDEPRVTFLFQVSTDSASFPEYGWPYVEEPATLQVDIYTVAGERVRTISREDRQEERRSDWRRGGNWYAEWDLTNESGADIASGVYLVYARLYSKAKRGVLLAEDHSKVLVIR